MCAYTHVVYVNKSITFKMILRHIIAKQYYKSRKYDIKATILIHLRKTLESHVQKC